MIPPMLRLRTALGFAILACSDGPVAPQQLGTRVLFIGNSLTYTNDLPHMVQVLAESAGTPLVTAMAAEAGMSLEDHWTRGRARAMVASGRWDVVVLQQGPSARRSSRENLREWALRWAGAIREVSAEPVVYMPWPESQQTSAFDAVSTSYRLAAEVTDASLVPGGEAWAAVSRRDPALALYRGDGLHPSRLGTYVAAVAVWARLTGRPAAEAPAALLLDDGPLVLEAAQAAVVREAVTEALQTAPLQAASR